MLYKVLFFSPLGKLLRSQNPGSAPLGRLSLLVALIERHSAGMVSTKVVQILDFVDADNPVLARKGFFKSIELGTFSWKARPTNTILGLARWEEGVIVIV